jgi:hypothetical protein
MSEEIDPDDDARQNEVARRLFTYAAKLRAEEEAAHDDELAQRLTTYAEKLSRRRRRTLKSE